MSLGEFLRIHEKNHSLTPRQIVAELDNYVVGQTNAKRAVAIALRNRWRRQRTPEAIRGEILPIGGLKEKLLAAHRGRIKTVLIPEENEKDLVDIPKKIRDDLDIRPVRWVDQVLEAALERLPDALEETKEAEAEPGKPPESKGGADQPVTTH